MASLGAGGVLSIEFIEGGSTVTLAGEVGYNNHVRVSLCSGFKALYP